MIHNYRKCVSCAIFRQIKQRFPTNQFLAVQNDYYSDIKRSHCIERRVCLIYELLSLRTVALSDLYTDQASRKYNVLSSPTVSTIKPFMNNNVRAHVKSPFTKPLGWDAVTHFINFYVNYLFCIQ